jgi:putative methionine-R-sulfoxide reductase with GAF domain
MSTPDADEQLRETVSELAAREDCSWAGIFFVEGHELVLGPEAGTPDLERRVGVPVTWRGERIAELVADGSVEPAELAEIAAAIADLCLVGWDTGGELWQS